MWFTSLLVTLAPNLCTLWQWWSSPSQPDCREGWWVVRGNRGGLTHILKREICFITRLQRDGVRIQERGEKRVRRWGFILLQKPKAESCPCGDRLLLQMPLMFTVKMKAALLQLIKSATYRDTLLSLQTLISLTHGPMQIHSFLLQIGVHLQKTLL